MRGTNCGGTFFLGEGRYKAVLVQPAAGGYFRTMLDSLHQGEEITSHHEATADRLLSEALARLGWDETRLKSYPKRHPAKVALATAIRLKTIASLAWLTERLHMGTSSYISLLTRREIEKHAVTR